MRARDLIVLLLSALAIFLTLKHEGSFTFREAWSYHHDGVNLAAHEAQPLPRPLVADLNGDGRSEVIVATEDAKIQIFEPRVSHAGESFRDLEAPLKEATLLPSKVRVAAGRRAVAMATGFMQSRPPLARKQVLAVVTSGWSVLCFDHNLNLLWEQSVQDDFPHGARLKEVAVLVTNYSMGRDDLGSVIVGGSMEVHPHLFDPLEDTEDYESGIEKHRMRAEKGEGLEDVTAKGGGGKEKHFSYYAFSILKGVKRWKHESEDFHRDTLALSEKLIPQHNYRLDAHSLASRHFGEAECRDYRESILSSMPHSWERREDTRFELVHFRKHRRRTHKKQKGDDQKLGANAPHGPSLTAGKDREKNMVARMLGSAMDKAAKPKRLNKGGANATHRWAPNAIVAHLKEGIEAVHLYTGRTICKLLLDTGGLHGDVNGDGVLDHVQAAGARGGESTVPTGMQKPIGPCTAIATSGVPVREQLFNGSICRAASFGLLQEVQAGSRAFGREDGLPLEVATPVLLPRFDGKRHRKGAHGDVIFLTSHGDVTSIESESLHGPHRAHGRVRWQVSTSATWSPTAHLGGIVSQSGSVATLIAMPLLAKGPPQVVLAGGDTEAVILGPTGVHLCAITFPAVPTSPLLLADFNDDGLNDIILVSDSGIYGFVQVRKPGAILFSALLACLILVMSIVLVRQHFSQSKAKPHARRSYDTI